jgi:excisionase family DNA binding protein
MPVTCNRYGVPLPNGFPRPATAAGRGPLATPAEIAEYLGVPVKTLYQWKYRGTGPKVHKVGRHLRYRWREVDAWLDRQTSYDLTA